MEAAERAESGSGNDFRSSLRRSLRHYCPSGRRVGIEEEDALCEVLARRNWRNGRRFGPDTEVWIADEPDHLIHFNGERFPGPYSQ